MVRERSNALVCIAHWLRHVASFAGDGLFVRRYPRRRSRTDEPGRVGTLRTVAGERGPDRRDHPDLHDALAVPLWAARQGTPPHSTHLSTLSGARHGRKGCEQSEAAGAWWRAA